MKESANLFLGGSDLSANMPMFLNSNIEGVKFFQNNSALKNSLSKNKSVKFESDFASSILDYKWAAEKICIDNDIAAVSYPDYTDINKVAVTDQNGGLYSIFYNPFGASSGSGGCSDPDSYTPFSTGLVLPNLDLGTFLYSSQNDMTERFNNDLEFDNIFIIVEFDGYYTDSNGILQTGGLLPNKTFEVFKYGSPSEPGAWYYPYDAGTGKYYRYPVLNSVYYAQKQTLEFNTGLTSPRLQTLHVSDYDLTRLSYFSSQLSEIYPNYCIRYGFVGYKTITFVKYTPVIKCGRVDFYIRKSGLITRYQNDKYVCTNHKLQDGDIIEVVSTNINGVSNLTGARYVQVVDNDSILIYEDAQMTKRIRDENIRFAEFNCIGNVYDNSNQGWKYSKTIFSPTGRNGQNLNAQDLGTLDPEPYTVYDSTTENPISKEFASCKTYVDIFYKDYVAVEQDGNPIGYLGDDDLKSPIMPIRKRGSSLDCFWADKESFAHSYRFGSDIDMKSINNQTRIVIGERGPDRIFKTKYKYLPYNLPYGRCHLMTLSRNGQNEVSVTNNSANTYDASSFDASIPKLDIIRSQTRISNVCLPGEPFLNGYSQTTQSQSLNTFIPYSPHHFDRFSFSENLTVYADPYFNDYWYGALVAHRGVITLNALEDSPDMVLIKSYSSDSYDPVINFLFSSDFIFSTDGYFYYPYLDSFGKSVALGESAGKTIIAVSSINKTTLLPPVDRENGFGVNTLPEDSGLPYDATIPSTVTHGGIDYGYVHILNTTDSSKNGTIKKYQNYISFAASYYCQSYASERFARCIKFLNNDLYVGDPMAPDMTNISVSSPVNIDRSRINVYAVSPSSFSYLYSIIRPQEFIVIQNSFTGYSVHEKEIEIKEQERLFNEYFQRQASRKIYVSDRFGENFELNNDILAANTYSIFNTSNVLHTNIAPVNRQIIDFFYIAGLDLKIRLYELGNPTPIVNLEPCIERPGRPGYYYVELSGIPINTYELELVMDLSMIYVVASSELNITASSGVFYPSELTDGTSNNTGDGSPPTVIDDDDTISANTPEYLADYIYIYAKTGSWNYVTKLSPSINRSLAKYDYENTIGLDFPASLKRYGNKTYENTTANSVTWDTDLTDCYLVVDNYILLKDPIGYAVFDSLSGYNCVFSFIGSLSILKKSENERVNYTNPIIAYGTSKFPYFDTPKELTASWAFLGSETKYSDDGEITDLFSFDYATSIEIAKNEIFPLFMTVSTNIAQNVNLSMASRSTLDDDMTLHQNANASELGVATLYMGPATMTGNINLRMIVSNIVPPAVGQTDLFISNEDRQSMDLFLKLPEYSDCSLYCLGPIPDSASQDLLLKAPEPTQEFVTLNISGANISDGRTDIYLENIPDGFMKSVLPLFIGKEFEPSSDSVELVLRGSVSSGTSYQESPLDVFMEGGPLRPEDNVLLRIIASSTGDSSEMLPLKIQNEPERGSSVENIPLSIPTTSGNSIFYSGIGNSRNLTIKGSETSSDGTTLFLKRIGEGGGNESVESISFYIHNNNVSSGVSIIIDGVNGISQEMNIAIPNTRGLLTDNVNQFIRGYEE